MYKTTTNNGPWWIQPRTTLPCGMRPNYCGTLKNVICVDTSKHEFTQQNSLQSVGQSMRHLVCKWNIWCWRGDILLILRRSCLFTVKFTKIKFLLSTYYWSQTAFLSCGSSQHKYCPNSKSSQFYGIGLVTNSNKSNPITRTLG